VNAPLPLQSPIAQMRALWWSAGRRQQRYSLVCRPRHPPLPAQDRPCWGGGLRPATRAIQPSPARRSGSQCRRKYRARCLAAECENALIRMRGLAPGPGACSGAASSSRIFSIFKPPVLLPLLPSPTRQVRRARLRLPTLRHFSRRHARWPPTILN